MTHRYIRLTLEIMKIKVTMKRAHMKRSQIKKVSLHKSQNKRYHEVYSTHDFLNHKVYSTHDFLNHEDILLIYEEVFHTLIF